MLKAKGSDSNMILLLVQIRAFETENQPGFYYRKKDKEQDKLRERDQETEKEL